MTQVYNPRMVWVTKGVLADGRRYGRYEDNPHYEPSLPKTRMSSCNYCRVPMVVSDLPSSDCYYCSDACLHREGTARRYAEGQGCPHNWPSEWPLGSRRRWRVPAPTYKYEQEATAMRIKRAMLVYQAGIANVFEVKAFNLSNYGRDAKRLAQADFRTCENIAYGLGLAGVLVRSAACNQAGDIRDAKWSEDLESQPFSEKFHPINMTEIYQSTRQHN